MSDTILLTGCAGFLGSHLAERLLDDGHTVVGVDCFTDQYGRVQKDANLAALKGRSGFEFVDADLTKVEPISLMDGVTAVFHLAAHSCARNSWGREFPHYARNNVRATQVLLEASQHVRKFVYVSSASVYGDRPAQPTPESAPLRPVSPYGATKMAGEGLCDTYRVANRVPATVVRMFSVYGPRQRPDMALYKWIKAIIDGRPVNVYNDGNQTRDLIFVKDAADALAAALDRGAVGETYNVAGGSVITMRDLAAKVKEVMGVPDHQVKYGDEWRGDARHSQADASRAREALGFEPKVSLEDGLARQVEWMREVIPIS
ncbi:MAG: NAD-dependent epimerase/dehydratase family protein [Armatimonadetes bacterium]|nr:NAD-dependent epimerase/dehydratase family protein [Armatimonadota bacterium]